MHKKSKKVKSSVEVPQILLLSIKVLGFVSPYILVRFLAKLFTTPIKHKMPKREEIMNKNSTKSNMPIPEINKNIKVYKYGSSPKRVLLVHGWSGRGTQLFKFAEALVKQGYSTVSFDAPAHGHSEGKTTLMPEFIYSIHEIDKQFGPFNAAIGHSLGGMSLLNAVKSGFKINSLVTVGSGDIVDDIIADFISKLKVSQSYGAKMRNYFEKISDSKMDDYSAYHAAAVINIPTLVIHDENDEEVPVGSGRHIYQNLKNGELMITSGLGHRKILGDEQVIAQALNFIKKNENETIINNTHRTYDQLL